MHAGAFITESRRRAGLSIADLAELAGFRADDVRAWEYGHEPVTYRDLERLVGACGQRLRTTLEEDDGIDWTQFERMQAMSPDERARAMTAVANFMLRGRKALARAKRTET